MLLSDRAFFHEKKTTLEPTLRGFLLLNPVGRRHRGGMKKPGAVPPATRHRRKSVVHVAGLSPSRSDPVMAQLFS